MVGLLEYLNQTLYRPQVCPEKNTTSYPALNKDLIKYYRIMHVQKVAFAASYFAVLHALLNADLQLLFAVGGHN
jgi:hypothetical protein